MSAMSERGSSENTIVWVHDDCLAPSGPALAAYPEAPAFFVFDEAFLEESGASFKQVVFLYECLMEIPQVQILKGDLIRNIADAARRTGSGRVATTRPSRTAPKARRRVHCRRDGPRMWPGMHNQSSLKIGV